ncbi:Hypothetical protein AA314_01179 [Archangium gephyra]|uniref:Uncharacterized protein n=1 Tax=Archangium gephyra TaxID=48 RepID=A0AAC8Q244_9BACT|nr:Hypothetical protein AA314_01179 [Archangium gephyra]
MGIPDLVSPLVAASLADDFAEVPAFRAWFFVEDFEDSYAMGS